MSNFLGKSIHDTEYLWPEWMLQAYAIQEGRRAGYLVSGGMEQGKRSKATAGRAKATGLTKGWPDTTWVLSEGKVVFIEYKRADGAVSSAQAELNARMKALGQLAFVVQANCPADCWSKTLACLER